MANLSQKEIEHLLALAGKKLGTDPQQLKQQLQNGAFDNLLQQAGAQNQELLRQVAQNPKLAEQFLRTPQGQQLMQKAMEQQKDSKF